MTCARFSEQTFTGEPGKIAAATPVMPSVEGSSFHREHRHVDRGVIR